MSQGKHRVHGWVVLEARTDGFHWQGTHVCGVLGENLDEDFYRVELKYS